MLKDFMLAVLGGILGLIILVFALPFLAAISLFGAATSNAIISSQTALNEILPFLMIIIVAGISLVTLAGRK